MYWHEGLEMTKEHSITFFDNSGLTNYPDKDYDQGNDHTMYFSQNTASDWVLVPSDRPVISSPSVKTHTAELAGNYGKIDMTYGLTGYQFFDNRTGSLEFMVMNVRPWDVTYSAVSGYLHGRRIKAILWDDPNFYYEGTASINQYKTDQHWSKVAIDYDFKPFKMEVTDTAQEELWDNYDFERHCTISDLVYDIPSTTALSGPSYTTAPSNAYTINFARLPKLIFTDSDKSSGKFVQKMNDTTPVSMEDLLYGSPLGRAPIIPEIRLSGSSNGNVRLCVQVINQERRLSSDVFVFENNDKKDTYRSFTRNSLQLSMINANNSCILKLWYFTDKDSSEMTTYFPPGKPVQLVFRRRYL